MLTAIFLLLNSEGIPRTVVSKNGKHFMSFSVSFGNNDEDDENDGSLVVKPLVNFCLLAGGDFSNLSSSSSSVSES